MVAKTPEMPNPYPKEMFDAIEKISDRRVRTALEDAVRRNTKIQSADLVKVAQEAGANGQLKSVEALLKGYQREAKRMDNVEQKWEKKGWLRWGAEKLFAGPLWVWKKTVVEHPKLTAATVLLLALGGGAAAAAALGYIDLNLLKRLLGPHLEKIREYAGKAMEKGQQFLNKGAEKAAEGVAAASEKGKEVIEAVKDNLPSNQEVPSVPTEVPGADEARKALEELKKNQ